jgi:hypothetical protein
MTFTPTVLSKVDANNTTDAALTVPPYTFTGNGTLTTGYDTLILSVETSVDSAPSGLSVEFSDDNVAFVSYYHATVFATGIFTQTFLITKKYYRVVYTSSATVATFTLTTRISTQLDSTAMTQNSSITVFDNVEQASMDAFGKLRVSMPFTLLELRYPAAAAAPLQIRANAQQVAYKVTGGYSYSAPGDGVLVLTAANAAGYVVSQSRTYVTYQAGKSLLFLMSGVFKPSNPSLTSRVGYFESDFTGAQPVPINGMYLSFVAGVAYLNIVNNGSVLSVAQSAWNLDPMNGTGVSGLNLDFDKTQLFACDIEWLGVGRVRFGFYAYGRIQYCHQVTHLNVLTAPYAQSINLPLTCMLLSASAQGTGSMKQICATVLSEGGYNPVGRLFSQNTGHDSTTEVTLVGSTNEVSLLALRGGAPGYKHQTILPVSFTLIDIDSNNTLVYRLGMIPGEHVNTAITVTTWLNANNLYSLAQYATNWTGTNNIVINSTTNAILLNSGYVLGKGSNVFNDLQTAFSSLLISFGANVENASDVLLLTAQRVGSGATTAKVWASVDWQELY